MTERLQAPQETSSSERRFAGATLKVAGNCNMSCPGCYMYVGENETRRTERNAMSMEVVEQTAARLKEYASDSDMFVSFHGGEPLLLGYDGIKERAEALRNSLSNVAFGMQTNGLLLNEATAKMLAEFDFQVGISLDGNHLANDRYRLDQAGRSTYDRVIRAIEVAKAANLKWGLLAVIDVANDPLETYEELMGHDPPLGIDFLLPLANWNNLPPPGVTDTPYADWLIPIWDRWMDEPSPRPIKKFRALQNLLLGGSTLSETLGNPQPSQVFISDNGAYGDVDTLQSLGSAAPDLNMNVFEHSLDQVAKHPWMQFRRLGREALSTTCQSCSFVEVCGGGYIPHRYNYESGHSDIDKFLNPSVYCLDLKKIVWHARQSMKAYMEAPPVNQSNDISM